MYKRFFAILLIIISALTVCAQELEWSFDMNAVFNNRESDIGESPSHTFIFTRITPQVGLSMDRRRHRIMGGVTWYQPMIDNLQGYKVLPSLYYEYKDARKGYGLKLGIIANELNASTPTFLRSDSINYVQPNIKGIVVSIDKPHFFMHSWLDWRQIQTQNRREAFSVTAKPGWRTSKGNNTISASAIIHYNHLAKTKSRCEDEGVVDNVIFSPQLAYEHHWNKAHFNASAGVLLSCDRDRNGDNKWLTQVGFIGKLEGNWKWLTLTENIYAGERQMPLYEKYASLLYQGDPYYHYKFYSRTDLAATIFHRDFVNLEARLSFHATNKATAFWQQVAVRFYLDSKLWKLHRNKKRGMPLNPQF